MRRSNVGAAHSPKLGHALSAGPQRPAGSLPPGAGARGIDVASYQHPHGAAINWAQVARAGYKFVFIKAAEGNYYANPYYGSDLAQAKAAGLYATGYTFAVPNVSSGASQADYAVRHARGRTMPLALDIEYNPYGHECYGLTAPRMVGWLAAFTGEVRRLTGHRPIIYSTADWWHVYRGQRGVRRGPAVGRRVGTRLSAAAVRLARLDVLAVPTTGSPSPAPGGSLRPATSQPQN